MADNRRNLQVNQSGVEGTDSVDNNGWPTALTDRSNLLKIKVTHGSNGTTKDFRAMSTSGQSEISKPEGDSSVKGGDTFDGELSIKVKKTVNDSTK